MYEIYLAFETHRWASIVTYTAFSDVPNIMLIVGASLGGLLALLLTCCSILKLAAM